MKPPIQLNRTQGRWSTIWAVESESTPGKVYFVGRTNAGDFGCSCPRWIYTHADCKHVNHVKRSLAGKAPAAAPVEVPEHMQKALSRFALLD